MDTDGGVGYYRGSRFLVVDRAAYDARRGIRARD